MDGDIIILIAKLTGSALAVHSAFWFTMAFWKPRWFVQARYPNDFDLHRPPYGKDMHWKDWLYYGALIIGFGIIGYTMAYSFIWWMPFDWGGQDEDGELRPLRQTIQGFVAFVAAFGIAGAIEQFIAPIRRDMKQKAFDERQIQIAAKRRDIAA